MNSSFLPVWTTRAFWNTLTTFSFFGAAMSVFFQESPGGCGDYPQNFEVLYLGVSIGTFAGLLVGLLAPRFPSLHWAQPVVLTLIRYFLASILLSYGFAKVFYSQFPHMQANMDARLIELSPMRMAWAFFGYSRGYQMFLGWGEVIPALLLLFRRTATMGALAMFVVMLNVFVINIFFDVCVKLNSGLYMVLALHILLNDSHRLWLAFFTNGSVPARRSPDPIKQRWLRITGVVINALIVGLILLTNGLQAYRSFQSLQTRGVSSLLDGAWRVTEMQRWHNQKWQPLTEDDSTYLDRVYFEGSNGILKGPLRRDRFRFSLDEKHKTLALQFTNPQNEWNTPARQWSFQTSDKNHLKLTGRCGSDSVQAFCQLRTEKLSLY
ncbi:hypothetical protein [Tellurirhabdus bombi]|uniref:hypothetical protein n=1 Tax=Tellurirhabdus bombi TaxID=2907205 RepID=UPI001F238E82|nr:hypothetical protein [Tellurirhabdus bombi]